MWGKLRKFLAERRKAWIPPIAAAAVWVAAKRGVELDPAVAQALVAAVWALLVARIPNEPTDKLRSQIVHGD